MTAFVARLRGRLALIESVWEFARLERWLNLMIADRIRTLLPAVEADKLRVIGTEPATVHSSLKNQASIVVADDAAEASARRGT